jgi:Flp pilus assembly protein TadB
MALRAEAEVHSAQARLSARVLTAVPVGFCCWTVATSSAVRAAWFGPLGAVCAVSGGLLNLAGWWWMRHLVARATP